MITVCNDPAPIPEVIELLLETYKYIFVEPKHLPPPRAGFDHSIPLKEGTEQVNLRSYR